MTVVTELQNYLKCTTATTMLEQGHTEMELQDVIKFVNNLRQVGGFLGFPHHDITESGARHHTPNVN
jgi:hypothetical protein